MTETILLEFREMIKTSLKSSKKPDRDARKLLLYLFTGTRGGFTRLRIIMVLMNKPCNTHQMAKQLGLDYKAIQHHMLVLEKNNLITKVGERYGATFHLSMFLEMNMGALDEIIDKLDRKLNYKKVYL